VFTGIVEHVGRFVRIHAVEGRIDLAIETSVEFADGLAIGASVAVDGCCLTITDNEQIGRAARLAFAAIPETLQRTALGSKRVQQRVNLERALPASGRLDGHLVQGHVDDVGLIETFSRDGSDARIRVRCGADLARLLVPKGSVTVDGVSLTVVDTTSEGFSVSLIPHTLKVTTLGELQTGQKVNLEADVIGKYVFYYLSRNGFSPPT
jgi:riboflavin synthase